MVENYRDATEFLFNQLPAFEKIGQAGYKPGLERVSRLSEIFGNPHQHLHCAIHIAGTNGKGSTAHTLAAILQAQGYRVGLFTSPHLVDFRERIRVNGIMIPKEKVVTFVNKYLSGNHALDPSFFELTTVMAMSHFVDEHVDVAVIEVGLGGRLDSTNIITPTLSIITNIDLDHTAMLGTTRAMIASEKAGIIKRGLPVVIGESDSETDPVFLAKASAMDAPITFASRYSPIVKSIPDDHDRMVYRTRFHGEIIGQLTGECQIRNAATILTAIDILIQSGLDISDRSIRRGFSEVCSLTGLTGRWTVLSSSPLTVCDTGHNPAGWRYIIPRLISLSGKVHLIIGFVADKDVEEILDMIAAAGRDFMFYFVAPDSHRALSSVTLKAMATARGLDGRAFDSVEAAYKKALAEADEGDSIFIGGSNYVVAELLAILKQ